MKPDYGSVSAAFGAVAGDYDTVYGSETNMAMAWMRRQSLAVLQATFAPGSRLLELGCGAGEEAAVLAATGCTVLATDISWRMAAVTRAKAVQAGLGKRVWAAALPAGLLGALYPRQPFDGAFASFGALNCEPNLIAVGRALARLIRPGGAFVTSMMGKLCLFEIVWYSLHLRPHRAFRRLGRDWKPVPVAGEGGREVVVPTRYLTIRQVVEAFPSFDLERIMALPLLLPPPYADSLYRRHPRFFRRLEGFDRHLRECQPLGSWGDHTVLVLRRGERR